MGRFIQILFLAAWGLACLLASPVSAKPISAFVSVLPQKYLLERIAGDRVDVHVFVLPGFNPSTHTITPRQMAALAQAKVYFRVGVPFEKPWKEKIAGANRNLRIIDTQANIPVERLIPMHHHAHGHDHGMDPHLWTSPSLAKHLSKSMRDALIEMDPENKSLYLDNFEKLATDLDRLREEIRQILSPIKHRSFMVFHPAWGYFAREFELEQIAIEVEGKSPGALTLAKIMERGAQANIKAIFVQKQFSRETAERIASTLNAKVIMVDPLAENYLENLEQVARAFYEAMQ